jgi:hypothetical protein
MKHVQSKSSMLHIDKNLVNRLTILTNSRYNFRYCRDTCLQGLRKSTKNFRTRFQQGNSEQETGLLATRPQSSACFISSEFSYFHT